MNQHSRNIDHTRDITSVLHPQTNALRHLEIGPAIMTQGTGVFIRDDEGNTYLDSGAGLWCASLGFGSERLAKVVIERWQRHYNQKRPHSALGYKPQALVTFGKIQPLELETAMQ